MGGVPFGGATARREVLLLTLGFAALLAVGAVSVWLVSRTVSYGREVAATLETKAEIVRALSLAQDAETGQRGFLLTNDERYLGPYKAAVENSEARLKRLHELVPPEGPQAAMLQELDRQLAVKMAELGETVRLQREGDLQGARAILETERGRDAMLAIRRTVRAMAEHEDKQFAERADAAITLSRLLLAAVAIGLVGAATLAIGAQLLVRRQTKELAEAHQALAQSNVGLEAAVAERTADLTAANDEIQRFAYIVSHDLRAPLVNVMGFTSELEAARKVLKEQIDRLDDEESKRVTSEARLAIEEDLPEAIGFIRTSTAKMDRLINAILSLSRQGRRQISPESIPVEDMVRAIADTIYQQTQAADAEIEVQAGLPSMVSDRLSIEQVFQNLIENAVKYLDRSRPGRISVSGRRIGSLVEYAIEDNGRGIDARDHERVFELFRRAGAQDQPGEGLGLAFVRANVRKLGGAIRLTSQPGIGSTFHLTFPAVLRPTQESPAA
ncbi:sensor histidine kinase [Methylopila sp. M107]|uniref:sensor histidine kinase n=1 Tax=Methylopila sp. M107 TaxID=1101190 RepID=UPI000378EA14|nr:sensor histidine kinase [Methylopila sp. M107]